MIIVENLTKDFGSQTIFEDISFNINPGERIGLTGRNGHGKTTLFKIITGEEQADSGRIIIPKDYSIGYITQHIKFSMNTLIDEACLGLAEHEKDERWKAEKILNGLGFTKDDMERHPSEFSGGYQVRLNLAKVLVSEPGLLLLDEPTNYLDIISIRWLSEFLRQWENEFILITHDRGFMNSVTTHTIGIHRKKIKKIYGSTDKLNEQILKEEEIHEKTRLNDEKKRKEVELFINRFRAKARLAGMVQSRIKDLEKNSKLDKLEHIKTLDFSFKSKPFPGKILMDVKDLSFGYDSTPLIENLNISVGKRDRICVIGKNGKGKTTLLRLLARELSQSNGEVNTHSATAVGYFAQTNALKINSAKTVEEEIMLSGCERQKARDICGAMMFEGDDALKKTGVLSGGEKSRVLLGKILASECNLLLLDEPTNHLDMESCDALIAAIDAFEGAVLIVTHNEMFLHSLATRFIVFRQGSISLHEGSYQHFLEKTGWDEELPVKETKTQDCGSTSNEKIVNKKDLRKVRAEITTRRSKIIKPMEKNISETENRIENLEAELNELNTNMIEASANGDSIRIPLLSKEIHRVQSDIDSGYESLDQLSTKYDENVILFDRELEEALQS